VTPTWIAISAVCRFTIHGNKGVALKRREVCGFGRPVSGHLNPVSRQAYRELAPNPEPYAGSAFSVLARIEEYDAAVFKRALDRE